MAFQVTLGIFATAFPVVKVIQKVRMNMKKSICFFWPSRIIQFVHSQKVK